MRKTSCLDWERRIVAGESLIPPPLYPAEAASALEVFKSLRIVDAPGVVSEIQGFILSPAVPAEQLRMMLGRPGAELLSAAA